MESQNNNIIEIDLWDIWSKIVKHRQTIITSIIICLVLALIYSFVAKPIYKSTSRILIEGKPPKIVKVEDVVLPDYTDRQNYFNSQIEVLKSHSVASLVFDELGGYEPWGRRGKNAAKLKEMGRDERMDDMLKKVKITPVRMTQIVEISVEDPDPKLAAKMAGFWTKAYILFNSNDQLIQRRSELEQDLNQQYKYLKEKHPVIQGLKSEIGGINEAIANQRNQLSATASGGQFIFESVNLITNVKVLDQAVVPIKPVRPKKLLNVVMALFLGGFIGFGLTFLFESLDQSIKTPRDIEHTLKFPTLISIPLQLQEPDKAKIAPELITMMERHSPAGEAFRSLRTNILFSNPDLKKKILVVTSSSPSEGKTTVAMNLAVAFAQSDEKTLIIDADLRNPKLHFLFNLKRANGVTEALSFDNANLSELIHSTQVSNLSVMTCGAVPPNPSELLGSKKMEALLEMLSKKYDRIILDTPPILAATDAVVLSAKTDATIFVVKAGSTQYQAATRSVSYLNSVHTNVLGVVLNMVKPNEHGEYYYYYHYGQNAQKLKNK